MTGRVRLFSYLFRFIFLLTLAAEVLSVCEKEIPEDICPQREGFDKDCEQRCQREYPHRLSSACHLRSTGTLLSFFGIKSFICKCQLPEQFCTAGGLAQDVHRRSYSLEDLSAHSTLTSLKNNAACSTHSVKSLSCRDEFGPQNCSWQRTGDWYFADPSKEMPFAAGEAPTNRYLVGVATGKSAVLQIGTCPALCSVDSVNVTTRIWRGPWTGAELCFKEQDTVMCAPLRTSNGKWVNEVIPHTANFQIFLKFINVTEGDVVLLDDLSVKFTPCLSPARITPLVNEKAPSTRRKSQTANSTKKFVSERRVAEIRKVLRDSETLKKRFCKEGDCTTIIHHPSDPAIPRDRMCIGRVGLLQCREKCLSDGAESATARCVRQHDFPFQKRCLCQVRRSPVHKVDGGRFGLKQENSTEKPFKRALPEPKKEKWQGMQLIGGDARVSDEPCAKENGDELCDRKCISQDMNSSGRCQAENDHVMCRCLPCSMSLCDFENNTECGWTDMRMIDQRFGNVSIASKRDQSLNCDYITGKNLEVVTKAAPPKNRYGLSRIASESHSGLYRHGPFEGPITLTVDVYPTEGIDVRICVDTLQKCQTQKVAPKSWNRVRAKIKVKRAERIFLLFFNMSDEDRAMAMDNISLKSGRCASFN